MQTVNELIERDGLNVDACDDDGVSALQMAAANGHSQLVITHFIHFILVLLLFVYY